MPIAQCEDYLARLNLADVKLVVDRDKVHLRPIQKDPRIQGP
jgi:hypothetical protein